jgi:hypothetical protein
MKTLALALAVSTSLGCYTYRPLGEAVPEPGEEVRAHLTPTQSFDIGEITIDGVSRIEGTVYRASSDTLAVWGQWLYSQFGARYDPRGAVFFVDRGMVPMVETRRLQPARTVVAVAIGLGIGYGLFNFIADPGSSSTGETGTGPVELNLVPNR